MKYIEPKLNLESFHCPYCLVFSHQLWHELWAQKFGNIEDTKVAICSHCNKRSLWVIDRMVNPLKSLVEEPNNDLGGDIISDYIEAASILSLSPRGSAAILRLAIQKLCKKLGYSGKNINDDIAAMVDKGLNKTVQEALDIMRVVGNNAVHPGELDIKDDKDTASHLFSLINFIAESMISNPNKITGLYNNLVPQKAKDAIQKRDA
jgi:hypothetical protein